MARIYHAIKTCSNPECGESYIWSSAKREWGSPYWCSYECGYPDDGVLCEHNNPSDTCPRCIDRREIIRLRMKIEALEKELRSSARIIGQLQKWRGFETGSLHQLQENIKKNQASGALSSIWCARALQTIHMGLQHIK